MEANEMTREQIIDVLYPIYLKREIKRRDKAIKDMNDKKFHLCTQSHYGYSKTVYVNFDSTELNDVIKFLTAFVLPENAYNASVCTLYNEDEEETNEIGIKYIHS